MREPASDVPIAEAAENGGGLNQRYDRALRAGKYETAKADWRRDALGSAGRAAWRPVYQARLVEPLPEKKGLAAALRRLS
jgi:hypothetical protein